ncbi:MAG: BNR-4 repeat-containing protein, partial [Planctomycetota bacterium]
DVGSDRATAYVFGNKSVTLNGKTHVFWTDSVARTMARTYDHAGGTWSEAEFIGDGTDNHNNPSVSVDAEGRLHLAFGPHGPWDQINQVQTWPSGRFRYAVADEPNSLKGLSEYNGGFGFNATYASLLHTPAGHDCIVYRGGEEPYRTLFQHQRTEGGWENPVALMEQVIEPQYTFYGANLACAPDGTLYVGAGFYGIKRKGSLGCAMLRSVDGGTTWVAMDGSPASLPIEYGGRFAIPHGPAESDPRMQGMGVDSQGRVWTTTVTTRPDAADGAILSCWDGSRWRSSDINSQLPADRQAFDAPMCVDTRDRIHILLSAYDVEQVANEDGSGFGHPSLRLYHLMTEDEGATFTCNEVGESVEGIPNWLPSISQQGPYHPVENPVFLYTHGTKSAEEGCHPPHTTQVYCIRVEH